MDKDIKDSTWDEAGNGLDVLDRFEYLRNFYLRATKKIFHNFYKKNFDGTERVLEIGSGLGFLKRNWPEEFKGEWIQMDSSHYLLDEAKKRHPQGNYLEASVYDIPSPDESFDVVCGLSSFDTFYNLEDAMQESTRVLKRGGLFFHFLDLQPSSDPIYNSILEGYFLPGLEENDAGGLSDSKSIISYIPYDKYEAYLKKIKKLSVDDENDTLLDSILLEEKIRKKYSKQIDQNKYFRSKILKSFSDLIETDSINWGTLSAKFYGKRTQQQKQEGNIFLFTRVPDYKYLILLLFSSLSPKFLEFYFKSLVMKIEPSCLEVSYIDYVSARKTKNDSMY